MVYPDEHAGVGRMQHREHAGRRPRRSRALPRPGFLFQIGKTLESQMNAFTTQHPIRQNVLDLERPIRDVNQAVRGLHGLTLLLDGYEQSEIEPMYVLALLDPIERNLRETAEDLDVCF
jgi:hypothetical protein